jgi:hypothetical protein
MAREYLVGCGLDYVRVLEGCVLSQRSWEEKTALCVVGAAAAAVLLVVSRRKYVCR